MLLFIICNCVGVVFVLLQKKDVVIFYIVDKSKFKIYIELIVLCNGGMVIVWFKDVFFIKVSMIFDKIESIQIEVIYVSSEELDGGEVKNLIDGDLNIIWYIMFFVMVVKYLYWVDLDVGEVKIIKGFIYLFCQDSSNGNVKDYIIYVSMDGKEWGEFILKGIFVRDLKEKKVMFDKFVKVCYICFIVLSE